VKGLKLVVRNGYKTKRGANEIWQVDTTVVRLLDGTRAYVHAVIDNFS
jgi:hypothetical protein